MEYTSVTEKAKAWKLSDRSVRYYCEKGLISDAFLTGKTWNIPKEAEKPVLSSKGARVTPLRDILKFEMGSHLNGGIYHKIQIELTYNSNHIEGSCLTHDQTRFIYETNTVGVENESLNVDDIIESANHFRCIDMIIKNANYQISEAFIKKLHLTLKSGTSDSRKDWFLVGDYKKLPNEVGGLETTAPKDVANEIKKMLTSYNKTQKMTLEKLLEFHVKFERIHPFQDGNGRVGRLILFKECLRHNIVPFIIDEKHKFYYYRGLKNWNDERGWLLDTCLSAQDEFKKWLDYFEIRY